MKEDIHLYDDSETDNKNSGSKILLSRDILCKQNRNMRRMHSNSILNELRLNEKINQGNFLTSQQKVIQFFSNSRKNSISVFGSRKRASDLNLNTKQTAQKQRLLSQFLQLDPSSNFTDENKAEKQNNQNDAQAKHSKEDKKFVFHYFPKKKKKHQVKHPPKKRNLILSSINSKLREIDIISKKFDKINQFYAIDQETIGRQNYNQNSSEAFKILKQFESKIHLRKNKINERRNSSKKNSKMQFRYKVLPKRFQTELSEKQSVQSQRNNFFIQKENYHGLWHENARKMKNYITGGYTDQKQEYSEFCDIEEYQHLKNNFRTFEQICNSIKEDKDNPIGKIYKSDFKQPNILEVVSVMEKKHQISASKFF